MDFLQWEFDIIINGIQHFIEQNGKGLPDDQVNSILDDEKVAEKLHGKCVLDAIFTFLEQKGCSSSRAVCDKYLYDSNYGNPQYLAFLNTEDIPSLCEKSHIDFLNSQYLYRKGKVEIPLQSDPPRPVAK